MCTSDTRIVVATNSTRVRHLNSSDSRKARTATPTTPSVLCLAHEFARNYFFSCERPILSKPIRLDSIGEDVHFDVYLQCSQKKSWVS